MENITVQLKRKHFVPLDDSHFDSLNIRGKNNIPFGSTTRCPLANAIRETTGNHTWVIYDYGSYKSSGEMFRCERYDDNDMMKDDALLGSITDPEHVLRTFTLKPF